METNNIQAAKKTIKPHLSKEESEAVSIPCKGKTQGAPLPPGICIPWEKKREEIGKGVENEALLRRVWDDGEMLAYTFVWHCLVSF